MASSSVALPGHPRPQSLTENLPHKRMADKTTLKFQVLLAISAVLARSIHPATHAGVPEPLHRQVSRRRSACHVLGRSRTRLCGHCHTELLADSRHNIWDCGLSIAWLSADAAWRRPNLCLDLSLPLHASLATAGCEARGNAQDDGHPQTGHRAREDRKGERE